MNKDFDWQGKRESQVEDSLKSIVLMLAVLGILTIIYAILRLTGT